MNEFLVFIWGAINSPIGITVIGGLVAWLLAKLFTAKPAWKQYEGTIIAAIKWAEKAIPDSVPDKSVKRLDEALRYVLKIYEAQNGSATPVVRSEFEQAIQMVHANLEAGGNLAVAK